MKDIKVYNVIFPIWILLFFPPILFVMLIGNFLIDSLVIIVCFYLFKLVNTQQNLKTFYRKSILKVWLFGFTADMIGAMSLFGLLMGSDMLGLPNDLINAISYDPFSHPLAVMIIVFFIMVSAFFIFLFNYKVTFRKLIGEKALRIKVALAIAIITMPWTFLLPTKWFYNF
ncbi:hypothetical protein SAMN04488072_104117 [Lentibacillus halodurans]|uniref:Uncharacterized protein n=1 Tax=Lentibacillus halodurans TaxID=237679 RepID=A0A1I0X4N7_9BACI|nr:hypothetical protein [Lentibacillus halodurans]SFA95350.1 hypothetical protein SAMN04488072_104117 [Lentibacillus halodurans]